MTAEIPDVINPRWYGCSGDGITDDTANFQEAVSLARQYQATLDLRGYSYLVNSPIAAWTGMRIKGRTQSGAGQIINKTSSVFTFAGTLSDIRIRDCQLTATAGHVFDLTAGPNISFFRMAGVRANQNNGAFGIFAQVGGGFVNTKVGDMCSFWTVLAATVPPWQSLQCDNSMNEWSDSRFNARLNTTVPFFNIDLQGDASNECADMIWARCVFEQASAGCVHLTGAWGVTIENVRSWDVVTQAGDVIKLSTSAGNYPCRNVIVRNSGSLVSTGAYYTVNADANTTNLRLDTIGSWGTPPALNYPAAQTAVENCSGTVGANDTYNAPYYNQTVG